MIGQSPTHHGTHLLAVAVVSLGVSLLVIRQIDRLVLAGVFANSSSAVTWLSFSWPLSCRLRSINMPIASAQQFLGPYCRPELASLLRLVADLVEAALHPLRRDLQLDPGQFPLQRGD